jgi:hypothetical protein
MSETRPKKKPTKAVRPNPTGDDAWFDPIHSEKKQMDEETKGKLRQTESWHAFQTF